jgi:hypothetical protein
MLGWVVLVTIVEVVDQDLNIIFVNIAVNVSKVDFRPISWFIDPLL